MCILYRGEGSLPRDRAGVYEQCADLLFRRWDARRQIHQELRAGHLIEPALRHLAWWMFTSDSTQPVVTERELTDATTRFLHGRGFESEDVARAAAREFVEFCRGRMWVFSEAGITGAGERLYAFTHRTFLEYFAAAQLAYDSDSPEQLAGALVPHIAGGESSVVAELAMQIKDRTSNDGAPRMYAALLENRSGWSPDILRFLARCLRSVDPSPRHVRELTRQLFGETCEADRARYASAGLPGRDEPGTSPLPTITAWPDLLAGSGLYRGTVADEIDALVAGWVRSGDQGLVLHGLRVAFSLPYSLVGTGKGNEAFWHSLAGRSMKTHRGVAVASAETDAYIRGEILAAGLITARQALAMPGGPTVLFQISRSSFALHASYFGRALLALDNGWPAFGRPAIAADLAAFGEYLLDHREPPWLRGTPDLWNYDADYEDEAPGGRTARPAPLSQAAYLGAVTALLILEESRERQPSAHTGRRLGPLRHIAPYLTHRQGHGRRTELPSLLVPDEFKQTFRDWAEGRVSFTAPD